MALTVFPTLSKKPTSDNWEEGVSSDPTIKSSFENGVVQTRARYTYTTKKWKVVYRFLTEADKQLLAQLQTTVNYGAGSFSWYNHQNSNSYEVRFNSNITFKIETGIKDKWSATFEVVEVRPNSIIS